jgi:hypothetical protein
MGMQNRSENGRSAKVVLCAHPAHSCIHTVCLRMVNTSTNGYRISYNNEIPIYIERETLQVHMRRDFELKLLCCHPPIDHMVVAGRSSYLGRCKLSSQSCHNSLTGSLEGYFYLNSF